MTGCIAQRKDVYYIRLTYYDRHHKRKDKWVTTGLSGRGAKEKLRLSTPRLYGRVNPEYCIEIKVQ